MTVTCQTCQARVLSYFFLYCGSYPFFYFDSIKIIFLLRCDSYSSLFIPCFTVGVGTQNSACGLTMQNGWEVVGGWEWGDGGKVRGGALRFGFCWNGQVLSFISGSHLTFRHPLPAFHWDLEFLGKIRVLADKRRDMNSTGPKSSFCKASFIWLCSTYKVVNADD